MNHTNKQKAKCNQQERFQTLSQIKLAWLWEFSGNPVKRWHTQDSTFTSSTNGTDKCSLEFKKYKIVFKCKIVFASENNKNDQTVFSTLQCVTIISDKFLKSNGIKNWEVPY